MKQNSQHDRILEDSRRLADGYNRGVLASVGLHVSLVVLTVALPGLLPSSGEFMFGDPNAGTSGIAVGLAPSSAGIPLPLPPVVNEDAAANESAGFFDEQPAPAESPAPEPEAPVDAEPIARNPVPVEDLRPPAPDPPAPDPPAQPPAPPTPNPPANASVAPDNRPDNAIPFGEGGQVALPVGRNGQGEGTGLSLGDGVFGERYGTYVTAMRNKIAGNWFQASIDPSIRSARRVYVTFNIERNGEITDERIAESSGNPEVDRSALRAVLRSSPLQALPRDFRGSRVSVRFWFELQR
jgi:TonB family protein